MSTCFPEMFAIFRMKCLNKGNEILLFLSYLFVRKIRLSWRVGYGMDGSMDG